MKMKDCRYIINIKKCDNTLLFHIIMFCCIYYIFTIMMIKMAKMIMKMEDNRYIIIINRCDSASLFHIILCCYIYYILNIMMIRMDKMIALMTLYIALTLLKEVDKIEREVIKMKISRFVKFFI